MELSDSEVKKAQQQRNKLVNQIWKLAEAGDIPKLEKYLKAKAIPVDYLDADAATALTIAAGRGLLTAVKNLVFLGAKVDRAPGSRFVPLNSAGGYGHDDIVKFLISSGADVNAELTPGFPLLRCYIHHAPCISTTKLLLDAGANARFVDENGWTLLMEAAWWKRPDEKDDIRIMELLIEHGANASAIDKRGRTALDIATTRGNEEHAAFLRQVRPK